MSCSKPLRDSSDSKGTARSNAFECFQSSRIGREFLSFFADIPPRLQKDFIRQLVILFESGKKWPHFTEKGWSSLFGCAVFQAWGALPSFYDDCNQEDRRSIVLGFQTLFPTDEGAAPVPGAQHLQVQQLGEGGAAPAELPCVAGAAGDAVDPHIVIVISDDDVPVPPAEHLQVQQLGEGGAAPAELPCVAGAAGKAADPYEVFVISDGEDDTTGSSSRKRAKLQPQLGEGGAAPAELPCVAGAAGEAAPGTLSFEDLIEYIKKELLLTGFLPSKITLKGPIATVTPQLGSLPELSFDTSKPGKKVLILVVNGKVRLVQPGAAWPQKGPFYNLMVYNDVEGLYKGDYPSGISFCGTEIVGFEDAIECQKKDTGLFHRVKKRKAGTYYCVDRVAWYEGSHVVAIVDVSQINVYDETLDTIPPTHQKKEPSGI